MGELKRRGQIWWIRYYKNGKRHEESSGSEKEGDAKSLLQERTQSGGAPAPTYRLVAEEGPAHARCFVVRVEVEGREVAEGRGRSKKLAEQDAAQKALAQLPPAPEEG